MTEPIEEPWPFGSGTADDPYVAPEGWSLDFTEEEAQAWWATHPSNPEAT